MISIKILKSSEDYLETILVLHQQHGYVRSIDIANELSFSKASVSVAMKNLRENGYISMDSNGYITLEDKGLEIAQNVLEKHRLLTAVLEKIGVSHEVATQDACLMEHVISDETFNALKNLKL